jgi:putative transposase
MIERTHPKLSVGAQCQLLSISRSLFHYAPQGETAMNLDLMLMIEQKSEGPWPQWGRESPKTAMV